MALLSIRRMETDVLVIGAGGAGCFAAITAADRGARVLILNKGRTERNNHADRSQFHEGAKSDLGFRMDELFKGFSN